MPRPAPPPQNTTAPRRSQASDSFAAKPPARPGDPEPPEPKPTPRRSPPMAHALLSIRVCPVARFRSRCRVARPGASRAHARDPRGHRRMASADCGLLDCDDGDPSTTTPAASLRAAPIPPRTVACARTTTRARSSTSAPAARAPPESPKNCSDANPCTTDTCDPGTGTCGYADNTAGCSDADACAIGDVCGGGSCQPGAPLVCDDAKECTDDSCNPSHRLRLHQRRREHVLRRGASAPPAITAPTVRASETPPYARGRLNPCTTAICQPGAGCGFIFNTASCDDGDGCTMNDVCAGGTCTAGTPKSCADANPCTTDTCDPANGTCGYADNTESCSDADACTTGDVCGGGSCLPGTPIVCDDAKECTDDGCNPSTGCVFTNDDANTCSDADLCTTADHCTSGLCAGDTLTCPDDGNVCTTAACAPATGCAQLPNTASCDDGDACTAQADHCSAGACVGTAGACAACPALPSETCLVARPQGSTIALKDAVDPRRDSLSWRWQSPIAMTPGDPTVDVGLRLCVYDQTAGASALALSVDLPPVVPAGAVRAGGAAQRRRLQTCSQRRTRRRLAAFQGGSDQGRFRARGGRPRARDAAVAATKGSARHRRAPPRRPADVLVSSYGALKRARLGAFKAVSE